NFMPAATAAYTTTTRASLWHAPTSTEIPPATPAITWANPANIVYGTALGATQLNATASYSVNGSTVNVPGTFTYTPGAGTVLNLGNNQTLSVSFTPTDTTDYTAAGATTTINARSATSHPSLAAL